MSDNDALSALPKDDPSIGEMRERLAIALSVHGAEIPEAERIALASALSKPSPVDAIVSAFAVIAAIEAPYGDVLRSRAIEAAELIASHQWHGKTDEASAFAASARALLAPIEEGGE